MITLENNDLIVSIKNVGAELTRLFNKNTNIEYVWNGDATYWGRHAPVLFPIVGKLRDNKTIINDTEYEMTQHGFARDAEFYVVEQTETSVTWRTEATEETKQRYPYHFVLDITYALEGAAVVVTWTVKNENQTSMYFSIGAHPAFNVPLCNGEQVDDYYFSLETDTVMHQYDLIGPHVSGKRSIERIERMDIKPEIFQNDAIIFDGVHATSIRSTKHEHGVRVNHPNFPYVGLWSPYYKETNTMAPFVCIEPWYGIADYAEHNHLFIEKQGVRMLEPNESFTVHHEILTF